MGEVQDALGVAKGSWSAHSNSVKTTRRLEEIMLVVSPIHSALINPHERIPMRRRQLSAAYRAVPDEWESKIAGYRVPGEQ